MALAGLLVAVAGPAAATAPSQPTGPRPTPTRSVDAGVVDGSYLVLLRGRQATGHGANTTQATHPTQRQQQVAAAVRADPFYHYTAALNGFAARMSEPQAAKLRRRADVLAVVADAKRRLAGVDTATAAREWAGAGVSRRPSARAAANGRGVVIGLIDSGLDSDNPAFAARGARAPARFTGVCDAGAEKARAAQFACNGKVVGGRYFVAGQGGHDAVWAGEHLSPADRDGHGTQAASIAAAEPSVRTPGARTDLGQMSGVAPAAAVAAYKACWLSSDGRDSCATSDTVAAIDRAVSDGVDVLHVAVSGPTGAAVDPVALATMYAADAGVFVASPAGNGGPTPGSVEHAAPWVTTVAAVDPADPSGVVVLGDGRRFAGADVSAARIGPAPLLHATDAPTRGGGSAATAAGLCLRGSLDKTAVDGAIVVCERGRSARTAKSRVVAAAGGVGMILTSRERDRLHADLHRVPTVHLGTEASQRVSDYARRASRPTARIVGSTGSDTGASAAVRPRLAPFSGRGPATAAGRDLLKPDLAAPGVDVVAATTGGRSDPANALVTGTSMSSAAVAGHGARLVQRHPTWSPMQVKSALMTTATGPTRSRPPLGVGAGVATSRRAVDPGLVLDSGLDDWGALLAGQGHRGLAPRDAVAGAAGARASQLNLPSVAIGGLAGREVVTRTFTSVARTRSTYTVAVTGLDGLTVTAEPTAFTLAPGDSQRVSLRVGYDGAPLDRPVSGQIVLSDGPSGHRVRLPAVVRPIGLRAADEIRLKGGRAEVSVRAGVTDVIRPRVRGLVEGVDTAGTGSDTGGADFDPALAGNWSQPLEVFGRRDLVRVQTVAADRRDDLDLYLVDTDGDVVASAATPSADETLTVSGLAAGTYTAHVQPWFVQDGSGDTDFDVRTFVVPGRAAQRSATVAAAPLSVTPQAAAVQTHRDYRWRISGRGLEDGAAYLGRVVWRRDGRLGEPLASTVIATD
ncbi:hypothetical protein BH20ACT6_BH20ACT6_22280 [soil metagenome]